MDDTAWKLLAGLFGAIVGAVIAAVINLIAATKKVQEVELRYRYKLHENYPENARKYIENVYVTINIALTELSDSYKKFRPHINLDDSTAPKNVFIRP
jgi:gas vesicle protein